MKIAYIAALSALALLAACNKPGEAPAAPAAQAEAPVTLKAPAGVYVLDPTHATLQWSLLHNTISHYTARFDKVEAELSLDPANLENSRITATIAPTSVSAAYPADYQASHGGSGFTSWDDDIANSPNFLNAKSFPTISFASTAVEKTGARTAKVTGNLTFLGQTHPVTLDATFNGEIERHPFAQVPAVGFAAEGKFKRSDFGMAVGPVGDEVTIRFDGEFIQRAAPAAPAN
ncbi:YceI family protein [Brevundimonas sp. G8]|uniref:YceI family protein n=1 Tax=Brevundimonas sp. G8 TaxID=1350776 RepID=UPI0012F2D68E|nr:YceI family protein [Brevundimonas sp. G8]VXB43445.1 Protein YceI [Brevundimonas sp. G8]